VYMYYLHIIRFIIWCIVVVQTFENIKNLQLTPTSSVYIIRISIIMILVKIRHRPGLDFEIVRNIMLSV